MEHADIMSFNWTLVMILCNFVILYLIFRHFFFNKIKAFMAKRTDEIQGMYDAANEKIAETDTMREAYELKLKTARAEAIKIVKEATETAEARAQRIIKDAEDKAYNVIWQAEEQIKRDRDAAVRDMEAQIAEMVVLVAGKVIEENLNLSDQKAIIGRAIEEVGSSSWQN